MEKEKKLYVVSNAHLDTQWNWTVQDTIRDCVKSTLEKNFELIEKYPHYKMNFEGAFRYKLAKEYYPDLYEKLKGYIAEGRWTVSGSTWDAMDVNVPSSEALMRQVLYGNGYFEKEFGKKSTDIFLTDCFGFRYALPSIEAHMGLTVLHSEARMGRRRSCNQRRRLGNKAYAGQGQAPYGPRQVGRTRRKLRCWLPS